MIIKNNRITGILLVTTIILSGCIKKPDTNTDRKKHNKMPKLVVGIVVDQMRYDYLTKYWKHYSDNGIKRLMNEGFFFSNAQYDYAPTKTGPGHASIYSGTSPSVHGIISNGWYTRETGKTTAVVGDTAVETVGSKTRKGQASPHNLLSSTITDEIRLYNNKHSKTIGVAIKDRAAVLPAGLGGQAYWYDSEAEKIITSTYYRDNLPDWVNKFNERNLPAEYTSKPWETLLPIESYSESIADNNPYEGTFKGEESPTFPHDLPALSKTLGNSVFTDTPFGNTFTFELAYAAIEGENLGQDENPDFLAVSFSSTDLVGHRFSPTSKEVEDTYIRFDRDLEKFLKYLDDKFGKDEVLLFLTADHGANYNPLFLKDEKAHAGILTPMAMEAKLRKELKAIYGFDPVHKLDDVHLFLNNDAIRARKIRHELVQKDAANLLMEIEGVAGALTADALRFTTFSDPIRQRVQNGYHVKRSGDVIFWFDPQWATPQWFPTLGKGTIHGSPWSYDAHIPIIWYGWDIPAGSSTKPVGIIDIASTVSSFLNIPYTSGNTGKPMNHVIYGE